MKGRHRPAARAERSASVPGWVLSGRTSQAGGSGRTGGSPEKSRPADGTRRSGDGCIIYFY